LDFVFKERLNENYSDIKRGEIGIRLKKGDWKMVDYLSSIHMIYID